MRRTRYPLGIALALASAAGFAGCWEGGVVQIYSCDEPCFSLDPDECNDPCPVCDGACVALPALGFDDPILLWRGDATDGTSPPECPADAPDLVFDGYSGFDGEHTCPTCLCTKPSCELPSGLLGSASATCDGTASTSFAAPEGWSGTCTAPAAATSGELGSLLIPAPTVSACAPTFDSGGASPELVAPARVRGCTGPADKDRCMDPSMMCVASPSPRPAGFTMCIRSLRQRTPVCPDEYPDLLAVAEGFDDTRSCTPCECVQLEDATCAALVSVYGDTSCGELLGAETVTMAGPKCVAGPDLRLESMTGQWIRDDPGKCAPTGGVAMGQVTPKSSAYFCCQSDEVIPIY
ncbi:hypothetical protein [Sorangium sp. So ce1000]|uniref:hypothetical protein n=1 Tax=Sorangium sp. So ce1000 TaxID=3133325 RepID=UPI003F5DC227